jgi:hypothetical protein
MTRFARHKEKCLLTIAGRRFCFLLSACLVLSSLINKIGAFWLLKKADSYLLSHRLHLVMPAAPSATISASAAG